MTDKLIGKTQKVRLSPTSECASRSGCADLGVQVTGKITRSAEMHEKGELREAGGKAAAMGEARAPHD